MPFTSPNILLRAWPTEMLYSELSKSQMLSKATGCLIAWLHHFLKQLVWFLMCTGSSHMGQVGLKSSSSIPWKDPSNRHTQCGCNIPQPGSWSHRRMTWYPHCINDHEAIWTRNQKDVRAAIKGGISQMECNIAFIWPLLQAVQSYLWLFLAMVQTSIPFSKKDGYPAIGMRVSREILGGLKAASAQLWLKTPPQGQVCSEDLPASFNERIKTGVSPAKHLSLVGCSLQRFQFAGASD